MKKLYSFLSLLLLLMVGTATASADIALNGTVDETKWDISESYATEITDGMTVVLQQGTYAGWSSNAYLNNTGSFKSEVDATCIYQINSVGTASDGTPIWVLKNVDNAQYLYSGGHTLSYKDAFQCSIMRAYFDTTDKRAMMAADGRGTKQTDAADGKAWILASAEPDEDGNFTYLGYWGCPAYSSYNDTNDWFIYEATPRAKTVAEKLDELYKEVFPDGFNEDYYVVGTQPSNISQEAFDALQAAYEAAYEALSDTNASDETLLAAIEKVQAAYTLYQNSIVKIVPGKYYQFINQRSQDAMYDNGSALVCKSGYSLGDAITIDEAKYIWSVEDAGDDMFYLQNFSTKRYMGTQTTTSAQFPTEATAATRVSITYNDNKYFLLIDESGDMAHNAGNMAVVKWNDKAAGGNQWLIKEVSAELVTPLVEAIEKNNFITSFKELVSEAESTTTSYIYDSDVTFDDKYASEGLFNTMTGNHTESSEGSIAAAFDGDLTTYYHTNWSSSATFNDYDWVQFDLGKEVQNVFLKATQRHNNRNGNPSRYFLVAPAAGEENEDVWTDTIYQDTLIYAYTTNYSTGTIANTTAVVELNFDHAVQLLRFGVTQTVANQKFGGYGPCWHLAEIRMYENAGRNPRYDLIPEEIRNALSAQIESANAKLADSTCVQSDYDALRAAIDAFVAAYPDDSRLSTLIKEAEEQATAEGVTGTALGFFPEGAQSTLSSEVEAVKTAIDGKVLTLSQIEEYLAKVRQSLADYKSKLIVPADGAFVRIKSESITESGEEAAAYGNYIIANNADTLANIRWNYSGDDNYETRLNAVWVAKKQADGSFAFRNVATGRYLQNPYTGVEDADDVTMGKQLKSGDADNTFTFASAKEGGKFVIELSEGVYVNADPSGPIVNWSSAGGNSVFSVEEVDADDIYIHTHNVKANSLQIVSVPFAAMSIAPTAYKVLGQKADAEGVTYLQLAAYEDDEVIPAGTPFIVQTGEEESFLQITLAAAYEDDLDNIEYVFEPVNQNNMVSAICATTVKAGIGLLIDDVVKNSVDGTSVSAGSGYFLEIPETTEDGELTIKMEDVINSIANISIATNGAADVYTISGVKVRSNGTAGLPAGLYIVGGKKVIVK